MSPNNTLILTKLTIKFFLYIKIFYFVMVKTYTITRLTIKYRPNSLGFPDNCITVVGPQTLFSYVVVQKTNVFHRYK